MSVYIWTQFPIPIQLNIFFLPDFHVDWLMDVGCSSKLLVGFPLVELPSPWYWCLENLWQWILRTNSFQWTQHLVLTQIRQALKETKSLQIDMDAFQVDLGMNRSWDSKFWSVMLPINCKCQSKGWHLTVDPSEDVKSDFRKLRTGVFSF